MDSYVNVHLVFVRACVSMFVHMYVCTHVCIVQHVYTCLYVQNVCTCLYVFVVTYSHVLTCIDIHPCVYVCV